MSIQIKPKKKIVFEYCMNNVIWCGLPRAPFYTHTQGTHKTHTRHTQVITNNAPLRIPINLL